MSVNCILVPNNRNRVDVSASLSSVQVVGIKDGKTEGTHSEWLLLYLVLLSVKVTA